MNVDLCLIIKNTQYFVSDWTRATQTVPFTLFLHYLTKCIQVNKLQRDQLIIKNVLHNVCSPLVSQIGCQPTSTRKIFISGSLFSLLELISLTIEKEENYFEQEVISTIKQHMEQLRKILKPQRRNTLKRISMFQPYVFV